MIVKITEIRPLKSGLFAVYADGEYIASIDDETLAVSHLKENSEMDHTVLADIIEKSNKKRTKQKALRLLSFRDHSKSELKKKLMRFSDEESAEEAASKMEELGLINDAEYSRKLAHDLIYLKLFSKSRAVMEMAAKGIDRQLAAEAAEAADPDADEQIKKLLQRKFPHGIPDEKTKRRASAMLARYGYKWDEIKNALSVEAWE